MVLRCYFNRQNTDQTQDLPTVVHVKDLLMVNVKALNGQEDRMSLPLGQNVWSIVTTPLDRGHKYVNLQLKIHRAPSASQHLTIDLGGKIPQTTSKKAEDRVFELPIYRKLPSKHPLPCKHPPSSFTYLCCKHPCT